IVAITFIFLCSTVAWMILGASIFARTESADSRLRGAVSSTWGAAQHQQPPTASYDKVEPRVEVTLVDGKKTERRYNHHSEVSLPLESSRVDVALDLEHRQKGLLWYSTYKVAFTGGYGFHNTSGKDETVTFTLNFPASQAIYDDLVMELEGVPLTITNQRTAAVGRALVPAGKTAVLKVGYRSQGLEQWRYGFGDEVAQVRAFKLRMTTNFKRIDFPENTLSPTEKRETAQGWELVWSYRNLVSGFQIAMPMPEKLQPGPLAGRISLFAPVSLFFFFFLMFIITTMRNIELHPMNYFFLSAAFFSFHLLLAYLVDHIQVHTAFVACSLVSIFLVISYLRLVTGMRFAALEAGTAQFIYLILFSYAFFFEGFTGLTVTIGSILTLFVVMQMTGRIRWAEKFSSKPGYAPGD
ncbi:MAG: inner membrane CreD family protein, partial [Acidobacteria bacterium]|nr:inner membrane CreD family protein [Acidobacteriota bacterium]